MSNRVPEPREGETESQWRQRVLRDYASRDAIYVTCSFDPMGSEYHPGILGKFADVAKFLRQLADDIEELGGQS